MKRFFLAALIFIFAVGGLSGMYILGCIYPKAYVAIVGSAFIGIVARASWDIARDVLGGDR